MIFIFKISNSSWYHKLTLLVIPGIVLLDIIYAQTCTKMIFKGPDTLVGSNKFLQVVILCLSMLLSPFFDKSFSWFFQIPLLTTVSPAPQCS